MFCSKMVSASWNVFSCTSLVSVFSVGMSVSFVKISVAWFKSDYSYEVQQDDVFVFGADVDVDLEDLDDGFDSFFVFEDRSDLFYLFLFHRGCSSYKLAAVGLLITQDSR